MRRRVSFHNLGCKVNAYETQAMEEMLKDAGYLIVPFDQPAEVCIINTCSVTNIADKKSRQMLHRAKTKNPNAVVVAAGCYAQSAIENLKEDTAVDLIIGNNKKHELVSILEDYFHRNEKITRTEMSFVLDISQENLYENLHISQTSNHTRAFIKVQDGCSQFCSYCIIPYTRGRVRSRNPKEVVQEVNALADKGCQEVVLTGIHLSSYGTDLKEKENSAALLELIRQIHEIEGIRRIRLGSLEPRIVTRDFVYALSDYPKLCPHFHLSLQSGSLATLKRMNRHYSPEEYRESCEWLRKVFVRPAITTDVIVGFPGESEEEFQETRQFLEQIHFYEMHVFKYSKRKGTRAAAMPDQVSEDVKAERSRCLLDLEKTMSGEYRKGLINQKCQVLLEEKIEIKGKPYIAGYTREYVRMAVSLENFPHMSLEALQNRLADGIGGSLLTPEILEFFPKL